MKDMKEGKWNEMQPVEMISYEEKQYTKNEMYNEFIDIYRHQLYGVYLISKFSFLFTQITSLSSINWEYEYWWRFPMKTLFMKWKWREYKIDNDWVLHRGLYLIMIAAYVYKQNHFTYLKIATLFITMAILRT